MASPAWDNADQTVVQARRWKAVTLANRGLTHRMVAEQMRGEYADGLTLEQVQAQVATDISRALRDYRKRADGGIEEKLTAASLRLNEIRRRLYAVIVGDHYVISSGSIVKDDEGRPLKDNGPVLAALGQLRALEEQQARLEGTNAREKIDIALDRRIQDEATDVVEAILAGFAAVPELEPAVRQRVLEAAGAHLRGPEGPGEEDIPDAEIIDD